MKRETDDPKGADPNVADWTRKYFPASTSGFWGAKANKETFSTLDGFAKKAKPKLENCIIHGPHGAGKTACIEACVKDFFESRREEHVLGAPSGRRGRGRSMRAAVKKVKMVQMLAAAPASPARTRPRRGGAASVGFADLAGGAAAPAPGDAGAGGEPAARPETADSGASRPTTAKSDTSETRGLSKKEAAKVARARAAVRAIADPVLRLTPNDTRHITELEGRIAKWVAQQAAECEFTTQRVIILEAVDTLTPHTQQWVHNLMSRFEKEVRGVSLLARALWGRVCGWSRASRLSSTPPPPLVLAWAARVSSRRTTATRSSPRSTRGARCCA